MSRSYRHIQEYEKEIIELKNNGYTGRQICEKFGFSKKQYENFITRYNRKQDKIAIAENFFSILKTECIYCTKLESYEEARLLIGEYIHFYNHERIQLKTKLTPFEKRSQYVA